MWRDLNMFVCKLGSILLATLSRALLTAMIVAFGVSGGAS